MAQLAPLILVVDDFEDNRAMYAEYLKHAGYRVIEAADGREAVARTRELRPQVVVMDLSLPVMDGWEATRVLKSDARTCATPIIALTGHALAGHSQGAREAGCDAFLAKPCLPKTLLEKIRSILATRKQATRTDGRRDGTSAGLPRRGQAKEDESWQAKGKAKREPGRHDRRAKG
jgi:CheY-like chemotaxis protein